MRVCSDSDPVFVRFLLFCSSEQCQGKSRFVVVVVVVVVVEVVEVGFSSFLLSFFLSLSFFF